MWGIGGKRQVCWKIVDVIDDIENFINFNPRKLFFISVTNFWQSYNLEKFFMIMKGHSNFPLVRGTHQAMRKMKIFIETLQRAPQKKHRAPRQWLWVLWVNLRPVVMLYSKRTSVYSAALNLSLPVFTVKLYTIQINFTGKDWNTLVLSILVVSEWLRLECWKSS